MSVVINADDLGLSEAVNVGIFDALEAGAITDCSLLAVGSAYEHAVQGLKVRSIECVGLHACLVDKEIPLGAPSVWLTVGNTFAGRNLLCVIDPL